jgi:hypothetical protein
VPADLPAYILERMYRPEYVPGEANGSGS